MKKIIFIILLALSSGLTVVSCTEENVEPTTTDPTGPAPSPGKI